MTFKVARHINPLGVEDGKEVAVPRAEGGLARALLLKSAGELLEAAERLGE